jgi:hypothetical protein
MNNKRNQQCLQSHRYDTKKRRTTGVLLAPEEEEEDDALPE